MWSAFRAAFARAARVGSVGCVAFVLLTGARDAAAGNLIGDAGAAAIAEALKVNSSATTIMLLGACRARDAARARLNVPRVDVHDIAM